MSYYYERDSAQDYALDVLRRATTSESLVVFAGCVEDETPAGKERECGAHVARRAAALCQFCLHVEPEMLNGDYLRSVRSWQHRDFPTVAFCLNLCEFLGW